MNIEIARATTPAEIEAVQRHRHAVYVAELGRYSNLIPANHDCFAEPEDDYSWIFYARDGDTVLASHRISWGGGGFSERQREQYQLDRFLAELPPEVIGVGERVAVLPSQRGTGVVEQLMLTSAALYPHRLLVNFGACEPHLLPLYLRVGARTYASRNINSPSAGYLIPVIGFDPDIEALRGVGKVSEPDAFAPCIAAVREQSGAVRSELLAAPGEHLAEIRHTLEALDARQHSIFNELSDAETAQCIARSTVVECRAGDRILKSGGTARNIFVVLEGTLEVRDGDTIVAVLNPGEVFGELAFLLEHTRAFDVDAATGARILCLSEGALRNMVAEEPGTAAKLLLNLSKALCVKLIRASCHPAATSRSEANNQTIKRIAVQP